MSRASLLLLQCVHGARWMEVAQAGEQGGGAELPAPAGTIEACIALLPCTAYSVKAVNTALSVSS